MSHFSIFRLTFLICVLSIQARAGYTQYFTWHQKPGEASLRECIGEMRLLVEARKTTLAGPDGEGQPVMEFQSLILNGTGDNSHEPFVFPGEIGQTPLSPKIPRGFNFCKTAGKPYDEVVTACLLVARDHFPTSVLAIGSDGSWSGDWREGARLYSSVLHRPAKNPIGGEVIPGEPEHGSDSESVPVPPRSLTVAVLAVAVIFFLVRKVWG